MGAGCGVDVAEIVDQKSLEAWLNSLPQGTDAEKVEAQRWAVLIAHRTAMRVLPVFWRWTLGSAVRRGDVTALPVLWANLVGGVAGTCPTPLIKSGSALSYYTFPSVTSTTSSARFAATASAFSARSASTASALSAALAASASASALSTAASVTWAAARGDCTALESGDDPSLLRLWPTENPLADIWADTRAKALAQSPGW